MSRYHVFRLDRKDSAQQLNCEMVVRCIRNPSTEGVWVGSTRTMAGERFCRAAPPMRSPRDCGTLDRPWTAGGLPLATNLARSNRVQILGSND
jgi:hypothetical protein